MATYDVICSGCGCETQVPFQPRGDRPVLCRQCYDDERAQESGNGNGYGTRKAPPRPAPAALARPDQAPDVQTTALAVRTVGKAEVLALAPNQAAEITWNEVRVDQSMTYSVGKVKLPDGSYVEQRGLLSNVWDLLAQLKGIAFTAPTILEQTEDLVRVEVGCSYLNNQGRQVTDSEVYEIDCRRLYELSRLKWAPPEWVDEVDQQGRRIWDAQKKRYKSRKRTDQELAVEVAALQEQGYLADDPEYGDDGMPIRIHRRLPPAAEREMWESFLTLKRNKLSKAITCAHRRLTQRAVGTKTLSAESLTLMFPVVRQQYTDAQIQEAVASVYGDEDEELMGGRPGPAADVQEAQFTEEPGPAQTGAAPAAGAPPSQPAASPAPAPPPAAQSGRPDRRALYGAFWAVARPIDSTDEDVRRRLAEWGCMTPGPDGQPSLRASTDNQVQQAIDRYRALAEELQWADEARF